MKTKKHSFLLLAPETLDVSALQAALNTRGWSVTTTTRVASALRLSGARSWTCAIVIDDPARSLLDAFLVEREPEPPVLAIVAPGDVVRAVEAMHLGATTAIERSDPLPNPEELLETLADYFLPPEAGPDTDPRDAIIAAPHSTLRPILDVLPQLARSDAPVLITGESGTGKGLLAQVIHDLGPRRSKPFVTVHCAAIPLDLMESELFGHVQGAFTGASGDKIGQFEAAHGGTIFLDEIADVPLAVQVKLLRVLQEKTIMRLGSTTPIELDFRIIAATNRDLDDSIARESFREDLYYRLSVLPLHMPPLRERLMDMNLLVDSVIARKNSQHGLSLCGMERDARASLKRHHWPGNIRELENLIERIGVLKTSGEICVEDLPPGLAALPPTTPLLGLDVPSEGMDMTETFENLEARLLSRALRKASGNKARAARLLGLNRTTFVEKLKRRHIDLESLE